MLVGIDGRSHRDVQSSIHQGDGEFLGMDICLAFDEHEGLYGLLQTLHCFNQFLPGVELVDLPFELL